MSRGFRGGRGRGGFGRGGPMGMMGRGEKGEAGREPPKHAGMLYPVSALPCAVCLTAFRRDNIDRTAAGRFSGTHPPRPIHRRGADIPLFSRHLPCYRARRHLARQWRAKRAEGSMASGRRAESGRHRRVDRVFTHHHSELDSARSRLWSIDVKVAS